MTQDTSPVIHSIGKYRRLLDRADAEAMARLIESYRQIYNRLEGKIELLIKQIGENEPTRGQVVRMTRYKQLLKQTAEEMQSFQVLTKFEVERAARFGVELGTRYGRELISTSATGSPRLAASFNTLPTDAVQTMIGMFDPEGTLFQRLDMLAVTTADDLAATIIEGVGLGYNPRKIARSIARSLGGGLTDALRNVRTAQMWAYREANRATFAANNDILDGWIWYSALDDRVCMSCVALHGTRHPISEPLNDHYNGRCSAIPIVSGIDPPEMMTGDDWFKEQTAAKQKQLMGPGRYNAWKEHKFKFSDLSTTGISPVYGPMRVEQTLKGLVG